MAQTMEVEVVNACPADAFALVGERAGLDILPIRLRADEIETRAGGGVGFFERDDSLDRAALVVLRRDEVVIEVVTAVVELIFVLLLFPAAQQRENHLSIEGKRPIAPRRLWLAEVVHADMAAHGETLDLPAHGQNQGAHIATIPRKRDGLADACPEVQAECERHVERIAERIHLENLCELVVLDAAARAAVRERRELFARDTDQPRRIVREKLHGPDGVVKRHRDVGKHPLDRLISVPGGAFVLDKIINERGREGRQAIAAERRFDVKADILLAQLQRIVARVEFRPLVPEIEKIREAHAARLRDGTAVLVGFVSGDARDQRLLLTRIPSLLLAAALAVDLCRLEPITPFTATLKRMHALKTLG